MREGRRDSLRRDGGGREETDEKTKCDEIGGPGVMTGYDEVEAREESRQLVQTNREWRDTYFVAHVF